MHQVTIVTCEHLHSPRVPPTGSVSFPIRDYHILLCPSCRRSIALLCGPDARGEQIPLIDQHHPEGGQHAHA